MVTLERHKRSTSEAVFHRRWTTAEYYKMVDTGILDRHERVELIEGEVISLAPIGPEHSYVGNRLLRHFFNVVDSEGDRFAVLYESPITLEDGTEPQPDLVVARGPINNYASRHPGPSDLLLVIEFSASTLASDQKRKLPLYAKCGIPEVWIVNLLGRKVETYVSPTDGRYSVSRMYTFDTAIGLSFAPDKSINLADLLR